jgi:hypothetical protein
MIPRAPTRGYAVDFAKRINVGSTVYIRFGNTETTIMAPLRFALLLPIVPREPVSERLPWVVQL